MKLVAGLLGALVLASAADAATYDAFASFDGVQGSGNFRYIKLPGPGGGMSTPLVSSPNCVVTSTYCLQDGSGLPGVYKSLTTFTEGTYTMPDDRLLVHPGATNPIAIFFTAPEAGLYDYVVDFTVLDRAPSGVALASITNAGGTTVSLPIGGLNSQNLSFSHTGSIALAQGEFFAVLVNNAGNYANDSTGVNFTMTTAGVPEPGSWALMIMGFGGAGALLRRRRAQAFA